MNMLKLKLSPKSIEDLEHVYKYTFENWGERQADKYQDELYLKMKHLASNPTLGQSYPYRIGYMKSRINRHIIFYKIAEDECHIMRILHERMNIRDRINE